MKKWVVSINIPTYNSERTIRQTLESIKNQTYKDFETIIIDSYSTDKTRDICEEFKCKIVSYDGTLLGARGKGIENSNGDFILLLDSDQLLEPTAIERAVNLMKGYDMLWLYERSYNPKTLLEKLYDADRKLTQKYWKDFINPVGGVILPRFYRTRLLRQAFERIPKKILPLCVAHDHAIIYYEVSKISRNIGKLDNAILHSEPKRWKDLFKKTYRYGVTTRKLVNNKVYPELLKSKNRGRKIKMSDLGLSIKSNLLRSFRAVAYLSGYFSGKNKQIPRL